MRFRRLVLVSALALAMAPTQAVADPISVVAGFFSVTGAGGSGHFEMEGEGFQASGALEPGVVEAELTCFPCVSGAPISLATSFLASPGNGTVTLGATTYSDITLGAFNWRFDAPPTVAPSLPGDFLVTAPFTFSGQLRGFFSEQQIAFDRMLVGQGLLTGSFVADPNPGGPPLFSFRSIRYDFEAAPVPEPATLLLFATGLGAALRYRKRRPHPDAV